MIKLPINSALALALVATPALAQEPKAPAAEPAKETPALPTDPAIIKSLSSYGFGFQSGRRFTSQTARHGVTFEDIEKDDFVEGFFAALGGKDPKIEEAKIQAAMQALGELLQEREKEIGAKNLEAGKAYLAENGKREGVITTESGLQYEILEKGGDKKYEAPKEGTRDNTRFLINYVGKLTDGTQFDASPEGKPATMTLQVVPGFKEALTTMPVGAKWRLHLPSELAYGEQRRSAEIAPNSVLVFDLELVEIQKSEPAKAVSPPIQVPPSKDGAARRPRAVSPPVQIPPRAPAKKAPAKEAPKNEESKSE